MTTSFKSEFLNILSERGFLYQATDQEALDELATQKSITGYIGFDCTADSLHVGNLIGIMMLVWLQKCGHTPLVVLGGATTRIGDPSGKEESRQLLTDDQIASNQASIQESFERFLTFADSSGKHQPGQARLIDNADWLRDQNYIDFLRDVGRHFTVNRMLTMESVRQRLDREQPLTFLEFNYMILQAYDFAVLNKEHDCVLQMGGSDQWGNIVSGVDLARRLNAAEVYGLTAPLLTTASGAKMGKTAQGAVWLNPDRLSPYDYWQFWRNAEDADVGRFLRLFTLLPMDEIQRLESLKGAEINEAKKILATEATALCHGRDAAEKAEATASETFEGEGMSAGLPQVQIDKAVMSDGMPVVELLVQAGLAKSKSEARRLIASNGARLNDEPVGSEDQLVSFDQLSGAGLKVSAGKKRHVMVTVA